MDILKFKAMFAGKILRDKDISEVVSGTVVTVVLKSLGVGLSYAFIYLLSSRHGERAVGVYSLALSVIMVGGLTGTAGFHNAILRFSAQFGHGGAGLRSVYGRIFFLALIFSTFIGGAVYAASGPLSMMLLKEDNPNVFRIAGAVIPLLSIALINAEAVRGLKRIMASELTRTAIIGVLNIAFFAAAVPLLGFTQWLPVATYGAGVFAAFVFSTVLFLGVTNGLAKGPAPVSMGAVFNVSMPVFATTLMTILIDNLSILVLGYFGTSEDVGVFSVAVRLSMVTTFILASINSIVAPKFAELYWGGKRAELKKVIGFSSKAIFWTSAPAALLMLIFPGIIMDMFGSGFGRGKWALMALTVGQFVNAASGSVGYFLTMTNGQHIFRNIIFLATVLNAALCFLLIPAFGVFGAACSTTISVCFWNIAALLYIRARYGLSTLYIPFLSSKDG